MYPPGIHQARCNHRSLGRGQQIVNYIFSAPPFWYLTIFGWQPEQSTAAQILQHLQGAYGILGNKNVRSLGEGSKLAMVMNNKTSRPPTYIFHGPPAKTTAARHAFKKHGNHKNQYNPISQNYPELQVFQVLKHKNVRSLGGRFQTPAFCQGKPQKIIWSNTNLQDTQGILGTKNIRSLGGGSNCLQLFIQNRTLRPRTYIFGQPPNTTARICS